MVKNSKVLVVGLGEIGLPIYEIVKESGKFNVYGLDLDKTKMRKLNQPSVFPRKFHIIHICIPCVNRTTFSKIVLEYVYKYNPDLLIINSTVPPNTTLFLGTFFPSGVYLVHSPVFGMHKTASTMKNDIRRYIKIVGGTTEKAAKMAVNHFTKIGLKSRILGSSTETELTKIMETTYAAWMITFFQEYHRVVRKYKADFSNIVSGIADLHKIRTEKPIWFPDVISGHCMIQNIDLLLEHCSSTELEFIRFIKQSNEICKIECNDKKIKREIEKIKKIRQKLFEEVEDYA